MAPDPPGRVEARILRAESRGGFNDEGRDHSIADDATLMVDVIDETVERNDPLLQARLDVTPFGGLHDAWDDVEGEYAFRAGLFAVDIEGDSHVEQGHFGRLLEMA